MVKSQLFISCNYAIYLARIEPRTFERNIIYSKYLRDIYFLEFLKLHIFEPAMVLSQEVGIDKHLQSTMVNFIKIGNQKSEKCFFLLALR